MLGTLPMPARQVWRIHILAGACLVTAACAAQAKEIFVNCQTGNDANPATVRSPLQSVRRAVSMAGEGDVVHLLPPSAAYREMISLVDKKGITLEGQLQMDAAANVRVAESTLDGKAITADVNPTTGTTQRTANPLPQPPPETR